MWSLQHQIWLGKWSCFSVLEGERGFVSSCMSPREVDNVRACV